jgi:hypothetical protein
MRLVRPAIALLPVFALLATPVPAASKKPAVDEFTAVFISMNVPGAMGKQVQIWIESYTPDDVAQMLATTLQDKGQRALIDAMPETRAGTIRIGTTDGYPISVARQRKNDDGSRTIYLASNKPFVGLAVSGGGNAINYPFGFVQLDLKADGTGSGTIIGAASLLFDDRKNLTVGMAEVQPGRLSDVKTKTKKK